MPVNDNNGLIGKDKNPDSSYFRKIHVIRQFSEASGRHGDFFEKNKNPFLDKVYGSMCARSVSFFVWPG